MTTIIAAAELHAGDVILSFRRGRRWRPAIVRHLATSPHGRRAYLEWPGSAGMPAAVPAGDPTLDYLSRTPGVPGEVVEQILAMAAGWRAAAWADVSTLACPDAYPVDFADGDLVERVAEAPWAA